MSIKLKKIHIERRRFLKTAPLIDPLEWLTELSILRDFVRIESNFQIVGSKVYFEISKGSDRPRMMIEVVGVPLTLEHKTPELLDQESCEILVHKLEDKDLFNLDLERLMLTARALYKSVDGLLRSSDSALGEVFHIVYDNEKIELHFFSQKDYIQNQF